MRIRLSREARVCWLVGALIGLGACGDGSPSGPADRSPPDLTILTPDEGDLVLNDRPAFRIEADDGLGAGILCVSIQATIQGRDYSQFFRSACDEARGEIDVPGGAIFPGLSDGGARLQLRISDAAGNTATASRNFTVDSNRLPPPPPPPS
ncbi:MAG: hypothetical protein ABR599_10920 [Gemmatimonadota bacterium]